MILVPARSRSLRAMLVGAAVIAAPVAAALVVEQVHAQSVSQQNAFMGIWDVGWGWLEFRNDGGRLAVDVYDRQGQRSGYLVIDPSASSSHRLTGNFRHAEGGIVPISLTMNQDGRTFAAVRGKVGGQDTEAFSGRKVDRIAPSSGAPTAPSNPAGVPNHWLGVWDLYGDWLELRRDGNRIVGAIRRPEQAPFIAVVDMAASNAERLVFDVESRGAEISRFTVQITADRQAIYGFARQDPYQSTVLGNRVDAVGVSAPFLSQEAIKTLYRGWWNTPYGRLEIRSSADRVSAVLHSEPKVVLDGRWDRSLSLSGHPQGNASKQIDIQFRALPGGRHMFALPTKGDAMGTRDWVAYRFGEEPTPPRAEEPPAADPAPAPTPPSTPAPIPVPPTQPSPPRSQPPPASGEAPASAGFQNIGRLWDVRFDGAQVPGGGEVHAFVVVKNLSTVDQSITPGTFIPSLVSQDGEAVQNRSVYRASGETLVEFRPVVPAGGEVRIRFVFRPAVGAAQPRTFTLESLSERKLSFDVSALRLATAGQ